MSAEKAATPPLASLVQAGDAQVDAVPLGHGIFMAKDISNAYLVTTTDGDLLVNSGFTYSADRNKAVLAPHRTGPLRYIVLTQAHADHFGGVPVLREPDTKVIAQEHFVETWKYFDDLHVYVTRRSGKIWSFNRPNRETPPRSPEVVPDIVVQDRYAFELGGRRFEALSVPGGESLCALALWMPDERIVFTGNLFGPVFMAMPNLVTMRGDKPRISDRWLASLERVRDLEPELLITGHGDPIEGRDRIRADLDRMHGAVSYIREATIAGMNAGKTVHTLMAEVTLPEHLTIGQYHGKVSWAVRSIWEELSGWFHFDSTTSLYPVPRSSVDADLVELAGGAGALAARADAKLDEGRPLEAMHLLDVALGAEPADAQALSVKKRTLERLLADADGSNLSEVMWLRSEIAGVEAAQG
jgi:alkyl sulfatase BDS1-like metallo-beta-lactamase superfamily hydrolase